MKPLAAFISAREGWRHIIGMELYRNTTDRRTAHINGVPVRCGRASSGFWRRRSPR
jgi:hypothetical protein